MCHDVIHMSVMLVSISNVTSFAHFSGMTAFRELKFHFVFVFSVMKNKFLYFLLNHGSFLQINIMIAETSSFDWLGD